LANPGSTPEKTLKTESTSNKNLHARHGMGNSDNKNGDVQQIAKFPLHTRYAKECRTHKPADVKTLTNAEKRSNL